MSALTRASKRFLRSYEHDYSATCEAAEIARRLVEAAVREIGVFTHLVSSRAKTPDSLRAKLRRKKYTRPKQQVTDTIGIRVITYYRDDVDRVADRLRREFDTSAKHTTDKRLALGLRDFGYRSVHLIARLKPAQILTPQHQTLRDRWFEIQIRSVLEHAWAEIEHEIVYKAGVNYSPSVLRRFAALAGSLELLDREFRSLCAARIDLIQ